MLVGSKLLVVLVVDNSLGVLLLYKPEVGLLSLLFYLLNMTEALVQHLLAFLKYEMIDSNQVLTSWALLILYLIANFW